MNYLEELIFRIQLFFLKTPSQKNLDKLFRNCKKIIIKEREKLPKGQSSGIVGEKTILTIQSKAEIAKVVNFFKINEEVSGALMTLSLWTFVIVNSWGIRKRIELVYGGDWIRVDAWKESAPLLDAEPFLIWLSENGIREPLESWLSLTKESKNEFPDCGI
ncbi:hypothetical protein [Aureispira anguillae]|uniref:Uncharacterized protein n=1 Tax=Aureispira anguillae TaxID=2864201 RepID=A0A915YG20_9BACT|nr:hypothetical protein [Aureispira anguillae]BDS12360.1 hypothetical protein AsAng_0030810 [Aureispira anguillae]